MTEIPRISEICFVINGIDFKVWSQIHPKYGNQIHVKAEEGELPEIPNKKIVINAMGFNGVNVPAISTHNIGARGKNFSTHFDGVVGDRVGISIHIEQPSWSKEPPLSRGFEVLEGLILQLNE